MLNITKENVGNEELVVYLEGRLDTVTAPQLDGEISGSLDGITRLVMDCAKLEYISSAGLRVFLSTQKIMNTKGKMVVRNLSDEVKEIFDITGFLDILTVE